MARSAARVIHPQTKTRPKYGNRKVIVGALTFDSQAEANRYWTLVQKQRLGLIADLECHPRYRFEVNGVLIGTYKPDFRYVDTASRETVVEDVKSKPTVTEAYGLRKKLMRALHGITVVEVSG